METVFSLLPVLDIFALPIFVNDVAGNVGTAPLFYESELA
jgi:hypothetical protein